MGTSVDHRFHIADIAVFGATIVISIGIGIYYAFSGGKQKTTSEFLLGGRMISFLPVAISLMVSFESSIMMLGIPAESYVFGIQYIIGSCGFLVSQIMSVHVVVPLLHPLKITSAYEYLELRFNSKAVRLLGTCMGMLTYCWYMGIVLFGPSVALEAVTGFPQWVSILTISMVSVVYTSIGGLKAVIWTDVFQAAVMFAGIFAILIKGTIDVGGPAKVWDLADKGGRLNFFVFDMDPHVRHTFFNLFFFTIIRGFGMAFNQSTVQRISSTQTIKEAKRVLWIVAPAFALSVSLALAEGIVAYAYYETKECDPFQSKTLTNPNQIMPLFVMSIFEGLHGMPGLFLASLFSASLSTLSSGLSSMSAMLWADIVHPLVGDISDFKGAIIAKLSVLAFGGLACGLAFIVSMVGGTLTQIAGTLLSAFGGPVTAMFLLGCYCPRVNSKGCFWGGILGMSLASWIAFGMNFAPVIKHNPWLPPASTAKCDLTNTATNWTINATMFSINNYTTEATLTTTIMANEGLREAVGVEKLYTLSYTWIGMFGILSTMIFGYVISLITGPNKPGDVDPRYLLVFSRSVLIFLPRSMQNWVGSIGPQFIKEEYKDKFADPADRPNAYDTEMIIKAPEEGDDSARLLENQDNGHIGGNGDIGTVRPTIEITVEKGDNINNGHLAGKGDNEGVFPTTEITAEKGDSNDNDPDCNANDDNNNNDDSPTVENVLDDTVDDIAEDASKSAKTDDTNNDDDDEDKGEKNGGNDEEGQSEKSKDENC